MKQIKFKLNKSLLIYIQASIANIQKFTQDLVTFRTSSTQIMDYILLILNRKYFV